MFLSCLWRPFVAHRAVSSGAEVQGKGSCLNAFSVSRSVVSNVVHGDEFCCVCSVLNGLEWSGVEWTS